MAKSGSGTRNLYEINVCLFDGTSVWRVTPTPYVIGGTYGVFALVSITDRGAPAGIYTFVAASDRGPTIQVRRDGMFVSDQPYDWTTIIGIAGSGAEHTFSFPGLFDIVVAKEGSGTRSLFELNVDMFNGTDSWTVP